ncbi:hypothetical protein A9Q81_18040 [Gammaproteobacteria bacterium 42_54_T18]|nr:hypothetical protein A9Q81_18040 [Gammaproteobacteria bacterium 42_54_T18]
MNIQPILLGALVLMLAACSKPEPVAEYPYQQGDAALKPVATVSGDVITRAEVDHALAFYSSNPFASSQEGKNNILNEMVEDQVFYKKAIENGFDKSPEFVINQRKLLAHEYKKYLQQKVGQASVITDYDIGRFYQDNIGQYTKPGMYRIAIYFRRANQEKPQYTLKQIADSVQYLESGLGFGKYALTSNHLKTNNRGGKLPWLTAESNVAGIPKTVIQTGESLEIGNVSDVIKTDAGHYLVRLMEKRDSQVTPLDAVKPVIREALLKKKKETQMQTYLQQAKDAYDIVIYEDNLTSTDASDKSHSFGPPGFPVK